jgi:mRNA-degrading endonuclease RelE of RelBE toxin-antitoxin system
VTFEARRPKAKRRFRRAASLTKAIAAGPGTIKLKLKGKIGGKRLRPGKYRISLTVKDAAGNVSAPVRRPFSLLK